MSAFSAVTNHNALDPKLRELVKIRASQINGCAYCLNMHSRDALAIGETQQRIFVLSAWRETTLFSDIERAALAVTEALTKLGDHGLPDGIYAEARKYFDEHDFMSLVLVIGAINAWNRLMISVNADLD